jgi:hypothetical protein
MELIEDMRPEDFEEVETGDVPITKQKRSTMA